MADALLSNIYKNEHWALLEQVHITVLYSICQLGIVESSIWMCWKAHQNDLLDEVWPVL